MKILIRTSLSIIFLLIAHSTSILGQSNSKSYEYHDAKRFTLIGKGKISDTNYYHRVDTAEYTSLPQGTKDLLTNSSGLMIAFKTNSTKINCKWTLSKHKAGNNMVPIMQSGLDLYAKVDGKWQHAGVGRPAGKECQYTLVENMDNSEKEFLLYLPLYNTLEHLEIGIDLDASITSSANPFEKKIVIYGSSITQGASAGRPGLSYTSRIGRNLNVEFINLGLSGRGIMEKEAARMTADIEGDLYILDCASNPSPEQITERTNYLVKHIRSRHPKAPIIMIQSVVREMGSLDLKVRKRVELQNKNFKVEYQKLIKEGVKNLYLIEGEDLLGHDFEASVDGIHPNDLGFDRMIKVIQPVIKKALR